MQYLLTIYIDESRSPTMPPEPRAADDGGLHASSGVRRPACFLGGEALQPIATATTVRVRDGEPLLTDGPFAETREQLGGYYLVDVRRPRRGDPLGREDPGRVRPAASRCARSWSSTTTGRRGSPPAKRRRDG